MASFNVSAEDSSPIISYAPIGAWIESPANDSLIASYSGGSLHMTSVQGATATIQFNGTGISIFGGKRPNYGPFSISVDGQMIAQGNAGSTTPTFKQLLGSVAGLRNGPHTAVLTNTGSVSGLDIDSLQFLTEIGEAGSNMTQTTVDDSDSRITYGPSSSAWRTNNEQQFMNGTLHFTQTANAQASLTFSGDAVAIYGTVSPDHANIQVTIDGQSTTFTGGAGGFVQGLRTQTLLHFANNLGSNTHTLYVTAESGQGTGQFLDLDAITIYSASVNNDASPKSGTSSNATVSSNNDSGKAAPTFSPSFNSVHHTSDSLKPSVIAGVAGGVALLLLVLLALFLFRRRRRQKQNENFLTSPATPHLPMQTQVLSPHILEAGFGASKFYTMPLTPSTPHLPAQRSPEMKESNLGTGQFDNVPSLLDKGLKRASNASTYSDRSLYSNRSSYASNSPMLNIPEPPPLNVNRASRIVYNHENLPPTRPSKRPPTLRLPS